MRPHGVKGLLGDAGAVGELGGLNAKDHTWWVDVGLAGEPLELVGRGVLGGIAGSECRIDGVDDPLKLASTLVGRVAVDEVDGERLGDVADDGRTGHLSRGGVAGDDDDVEGSVTSPR